MLADKKQMAQPLTLTKAQTELMRLLAKGEVLVGSAINGRNFGYETIAPLRRRRLVAHQDPSHEPFYSPERLVITERGKEVLDGKTRITFEMTKRQREILIAISLGNPILWQRRDGIYAHFQGDVMIQLPTISVLRTQGLISKLMPDKANSIIGSGYTITEKALAQIWPHVS